MTLRKAQEFCPTRSNRNVETHRRERVPMKEDSFKELVASIKQGGAILRGEVKARRTFVITGPGVRRFRDDHGLSQTEFASLLGISVRTLQNWEQGRREPEGPARRRLVRPSFGV